MAEQFRHAYATMDKNFIGAWALPNGQPIKVEIDHVTEETVKVAGHNKHAAIAYFKPNPYFDKPFILAARKNLDRLAEWTGTFNILEWNNVKVTLCQELDKNPKGGKCWALRIKPKPTLTPSSEAWAKCAEWMKSEEADIEVLLKSFIISENHRKELVK